MTNALLLPAELTIYTVGELRETWLAWLAAVQAQDADARADGAAVADVDAAGLQLLLSLARACTDAGRDFVVHDPSATLAGACRALGLQSLVEPAAPAGANA